MRVVDTRIFRPVSLPPQFAGAPMGPGVANMAISVILYCVSAMADFPLPVIFIFIMLGIHGLLYGYYFREPHLTNLMQTWKRSTRKVKALTKTAPDYHP